VAAVVAHRPPELLACLEASVALHQALPPIDAVAWDWIPAASQPLLLEGNGGFGLLAPPPSVSDPSWPYARAGSVSRWPPARR
jgi:hypothetical protein